MITPMFTGRWRPLQVGDVVTVLCQPETGKVKWDKEAPSTSRSEGLKTYEQTQKQADDEEFERALRSRRGSRGSE